MQVKRELSRRNPLMLEQVNATEQSLPAAATVVGLFLVSTFLDRNFLLAVASAFLGQTGNAAKTSAANVDEMFKLAFWSEFQVS